MGFPQHCSLSLTWGTQDSRVLALTPGLPAPELLHHVCDYTHRGCVSSYPNTPCQDISDTGGTVASDATGRQHAGRGRKAVNHMAPSAGTRASASSSVPSVGDPSHPCSHLISTAVPQGQLGRAMTMPVYRAADIHPASSKSFGQFVLEFTVCSMAPTPVTRAPPRPKRA